MSEAPPGAGLPSMRPGSIILEGALKAWLLRLPLLRALAVPLAGYLAITLGYHYGDSGAGNLVLGILEIMVHTVVAVVTHRLILLGPGSAPELALPTWGWRETLFTGYGILFGLAAIPFGLLGLVPVVGPLLAMLGIAWLVSRLALVLPGTAVDNQVTLRESWEATEHCQPEMIAVVVAYPILFAIAEWTLSQVPLLEYLVFLLSAVATILTISALSIAYLRIAETLYGD